MGLAPLTGQALPWSSELRDQQQNWLSDLRRQSASGQTDRQTETGGPVGKEVTCRNGDTAAREGREVVEETDILKAKREEFKGLREQMANCTRVSQPGSKSVLCIRMGAGGGERKGEVWETGSGHGGSWAVQSGLESVPLGDVSARPSEHVFPVLYFCRPTLPR